MHLVVRFIELPRYLVEKADAQVYLDLVELVEQRFTFLINYQTGSLELVFTELKLHLVAHQLFLLLCLRAESVCS